jgi:hypothetical protein
MAMEVPLRLQLDRRAPNWTVAIVSGFAAGAVLMVLDLLWSTAFDLKGPWRTSHMIAPIFLGADTVRSSGFDFSVGIVALALTTHYVLGIIFGLVLAAIMTPLRLDSTPGRALSTGAVFGLALYAVNFHVMAQWFPWLADLRGWASICAHVVFGMVAALTYWKLAGDAGHRMGGSR